MKRIWKVSGLVACLVMVSLICTSAAVEGGMNSSFIATPAVTLDNEDDVNVTTLIRFVEDAVVYAQKNGKESALHEFALQNGSFSKGDMYIWAYDFDGYNLAHPWHPEYLGKNKLDLIDPDGLAMIAAMRDVARNGSGFVWYKFENPVSGAIEPKIAYAKRVDDTWWLASGIYGENYTIPEDSPQFIRQFLTDRVDEAVTYVQEHGEETALAQFNDPSGSFASGETYIFAFDLNGTTRAMPFQPQKIGTREENLTDINGVSIGQEKLRVAREGGGFYYYVYENPKSDDVPQFKVSYSKPAGPDLVVGSGMYLLDIPVSFDPGMRDAMKKKVDEAASYVDEHGREAAVLEFNLPEGIFSDPEMFIFAFDVNGTQVAQPYLPGLVGQNRLNDRDPYGKYPVQQMIANARAGGGYSYYFFADPDSDYQIRLKLAYTRLAGDDLVVGSGIFPIS